MPCIHHPEREASARCTGCAEALCPDCHVEVAGAAYCKACKSMAVKRPPVIPARMETCSQARTGMWIGLLGVVLFTHICGVVAMILGFKALGEIGRNPRMCGGGMALAAIGIGASDLFLFVLNLMSKA